MGGVLATLGRRRGAEKSWFDWLGFLGCAEISNPAWLDHAFFVRFGSRILRELIAKSPMGSGFLAVGGIRSVRRL
jgi:hypothetical protein